jgi:hypothetical protein
MRLVRAAGQLGCISADAPHEVLMAYVEQVCSVAELPDVSRYEYKSQSRLDHSEDDLHFRELPNGWPWASPNYFDYVEWVQVKLARLRAVDYPLLVTPSSCVAHASGMGFWESDDAARWYRPPVIAYGDERGGGLPQDASFGGWLTGYVACHAALFDFVAGTAPLAADLFPSDMRSFLDGLVARIFVRLRDSIGSELLTDLPAGSVARRWT